MRYYQVSSINFHAMLELIELDEKKEHFQMINRYVLTKIRRQIKQTFLISCEGIVTRSYNKQNTYSLSMH